MSTRPDNAIPSTHAVKDFDQAFDRSFALVAYVLNRHLIDHMLRAARLLTEGDIDALVVWGVLAHQNVVHLMPPGSVPSTVLDDHGMPPDSEQRMAPLTAVATEVKPVGGVTVGAPSQDEAMSSRFPATMPLGRFSVCVRASADSSVVTLDPMAGNAAHDAAGANARRAAARRSA